MNLFERYLSVWVGLSILAGILLGTFFLPAFQAIAAIQYAHVNLIVAVLIWVMIYPMMLGIDFSRLHEIGRQPKALLITVIINWMIKPFSMAIIGILCLEYVFAPLIPADTAKEYIAGLILLGAAPCTAMVFVWSRLVKGDANFTLVQVAVNDGIMILAYAPITAFLLGVSSILVPWDTLILSVVLYVVLPILAGYATRKCLSAERLNALLERLKPFSMAGLLATVVLLFGFQATQLLSQPLVIALIAVPILLQSILMFWLTYGCMRKAGQAHALAAPAALIGGSNFFELAVAVAISLFGLESGAALATVVGVLVEVPAMLWLVGIANRMSSL